MTAPALTITGTSPFKQASRPHTCGSPWPCEDVQTGERGGYVGVEGGGGPLTVCGPCLDRIVAGELSAPEPDAQVEQTEAPEQPAAPDALVTPPVEQIAAADLDPWPGPLCDCPSRASGFSRHHQSGRWVHNDCGRPALRYEDGRPDELEPAAQADVAGYTAEQRDDDRIAALAEPDVEGDDPADDADVPECACAKVTKRAKFGRTPDGRPTHLAKTCGGLLREKHFHLLPDDERPDQTEAQTDDQPAADAGDPDGAAGGTDPGRGTDAGVEARPDDGAARGGEGRGEDVEGEARRTDGGDPSGGVPTGPAGSGVGDPAQPAHGEPVEGEPARGVAVRFDGVQASGPADVGAVGEEVRRVPPRGDEVAGLAAFYGQPAEDEQTPQTDPSLPPASTVPAARPGGEEDSRAGGSLTAFYRQPTDDEAAEIVWQRPPSDPEALIRVALHELGAQHGGVVTGLIVERELPGGGEGAPLEYVVRVSR